MAEKPYPSPANLTEQLQNLCWRLAVEMRALYNTLKTKMTKAEADDAYLGKTAKAASAKTADTATKATQDAKGNVIDQTYAKNSAIPTVMKGATSAAAGAAGTVPAPAKGDQVKFLNGSGAWATALTSQTQADWNASIGVAAIKNKPTIPTKTSQLTNDSNFATTGAIPTKVSQLTNDSGYLTTQVRADWNATEGYGVINNKPTIPDVSVKVSREGDRGLLSGYETMYMLEPISTITPSSPDSLLVNANSAGTITLTFSGGIDYKSAIKLVMCYGSTAGITLKGVTQWGSDNTAPTLKKNALLVVYFHNSNVVHCSVASTWGD